MDKLKERSEVNASDKWQIEKIYKSIEEFNKDYTWVEESFNTLKQLVKKFLNSKEDFSAFFKFDSKISRVIEKLSVYANCKEDEDTANTTYQELSSKIQNLYAKYSEIISSVVPNIIKEDENKILSYIDEDLESYRHMITSILRQKKHCLSSDNEKLLAAFSPVLGSASDTYSYLTNADMKLGTIHDEENKEVELNESNFSRYIRSKDRRVREESFKKLYEGYAGVKNTIASLYGSILKYDSINAKLRGYTSSLESYLNPNNIPTALYNNLIKTISDNLEPLYEYFELKKKMLGLDEFHLYDGYVSTIKSIDKKYSYEEAKSIVLDALKIYNDEYIKKLEEAFNNGWIDIYPNKGKKSGAYSTGSYDTLPYILLNYTGEYNDVSTLAHELGHSIHTYFSTSNQPYETSSYVIFLAEIASTTNELILSDYMYKKTTAKEEKLAILNERLDLFKATLYRQTMFAEFEKNAHDYVDSGNIATCEYLNSMYYDLNKKYFGDKVVVDKDIANEWSRIPHFYTPFYVYQYATSLSIACYVAQNLINQTPGFKEKYLKLLKSGGKDYPLELLKIIDINLEDNKVFESAIDLFKETLEEFKNTYLEK